MTKYYKVIKENPLWEIDAILIDENGCTRPIEEIWTKFEWSTEYLSTPIVDSQKDFFQRVYKSETDKMLFLTKDAMIETYKKYIK